MMEYLSDRQRLILALIIRDYIEFAQPVGSQRLVEIYDLRRSSATIRHDMLILTEMGFLRQPHTSAGRIPTEEGYRYFVRQLMGNTELPDNTKRTITHQFYQAGSDVERWMRLAASILAQQSQAASVVTAPQPDRPVYKHLELIVTHGRQALMVLVLSGGEVTQQMLALAEPVSQERLSATAQKLNSLAIGLDLEKIRTLIPHQEALEKDILLLVLEDMNRMSEMFTGEVYRDGLSRVLAESEFGEVDIARKAIRILEERSVLEDLLTHTMTNSEMGGVHVLIGGEGGWQELRDCSFILARYGAPGLASGMLGVLGPIRMPYGRTISTVRFVAGLLSDLVSELHTN